MTSATLPAVGAPARERLVDIAVLVVRSDTGTAENVKLTGPVEIAVRDAFTHPALAAPLQALAMDADRLIGRIVARWQASAYDADAPQTWEKSNGATIVRWWIDPRAAL